MRRWPFIAAAVLFMDLNLWRQSVAHVSVFSDAVCATFFSGYVICAAIALAVKDTHR
jgi:hypothetical protein